MKHLWADDTPQKFWLCDPDLPDEIWHEATIHALPVLDFLPAQVDNDTILATTLGEARFGPEHWALSHVKRAYYLLKPLIPRAFTRVLRKVYHHAETSGNTTRWPVEDRYVVFLWDVMRCIQMANPDHLIQFKSFWPENKPFAFILTHDVETGAGQGFIRAIADLEQNLGFRSSFNFVPERYPLDSELMEELRKRGFEIGVHGLHHDGKLYNSERIFQRRAAKINAYLKQWKAVGFRSPLTHRHPEWMQALDIEYDSSFFDTDPYEPIPGGCMSIWPFMVGKFIELPYTLVQDYTLTSVLEESTPRLWLEKVEFIRQYYGMALVNSHPDYLRKPATFKVYEEFLHAMKNLGGYWHALPREVAQWWKDRSAGKTTQISRVTYDGSKILIVPASN